MTALYIVLGLLGLALLYLLMVMPALRKNANMEAFGRQEIAHRGLFDNEAGIPENSFPAFARAIERGLAIEMDVQLTADGQLVVFHDWTTERMTGVKGRIKDMTLARIKELRLLGTDEQIPTLGEFLSFLDGRVPLCIEFKMDLGTSRRLAKKTSTVLDSYKGLFIIESFDPFIVSWVRFHRPAFARGQIAMPHATKVFPADFILRNLLFNFLARPHFISYDCRSAKKCWAPVLCRKLFGAVPVEWTVTDEATRKMNAEQGIINIFEGFIPEK